MGAELQKESFGTDRSVLTLANLEERETSFNVLAKEHIKEYDGVLYHFPTVERLLYYNGATHTDAESIVSGAHLIGVDYTNFNTLGSAPGGAVLQVVLDNIDAALVTLGANANAVLIDGSRNMEENWTCEKDLDVDGILEVEGSASGVAADQLRVLDFDGTNGFRLGNSTNNSIDLTYTRNNGDSVLSINGHTRAAIFAGTLAAGATTVTGYVVSDVTETTPGSPNLNYQAVDSDGSTGNIVGYSFASNSVSVNRNRAGIWMENMGSGAGDLILATRAANDGSTLMLTDERMRIDSVGAVSIGGTLAAGATTITTTNGIITLADYGTETIQRNTTNASSGAIIFNKSRNTAAVPTIVVDDDELGQILFRGHDGSGYDSAAGIYGYVDGTPGAGTDMPGRVVIKTSPDGSATPADVATFDSGKGTTLAGTLAAGATTLSGDLNMAANIVQWDNGAISGATADFIISTAANDIYINAKDQVFIQSDAVTLLKTTAANDIQIYGGLVIPNGDTIGSASVLDILTLLSNGRAHFKTFLGVGADLRFTSAITTFDAQPLLQLESDSNPCITFYDVGSTQTSVLIGDNGGLTMGTCDSAGENFLLTFQVLSTGHATIGSGVPGVDYTLTFDGDTSNGIIMYNEGDSLFELNRGAVVAGVVSSLATVFSGRADFGSGFIDASTARASADSIANKNVVIINPANSSEDYFALSDKVDGQGVYFYNEGGFAATIDADETGNVYLNPGMSKFSVWDAALDRWF